MLSQLILPRQSFPKNFGRRKICATFIIFFFRKLFLQERNLLLPLKVRMLGEPFVQLVKAVTTIIVQLALLNGITLGQINTLAINE